MIDFHLALEALNKSKHLNHYFDHFILFIYTYIISQTFYQKNILKSGKKQNKIIYVIFNKFNK